MENLRGEQDMAKIVIAEDDLVSRMMIVSTVEEMGHMAIQCSDGLRTHHVLQDNPDVKLLITDVVMPKLDGRELVELTRKDATLKDLPILVISGAVGPKAIGELLDMGATAFLGKPINMGSLQEFLTKQLEA